MFTKWIISEAMSEEAKESDVDKIDKALDILNAARVWDIDTHSHKAWRVWKGRKPDMPENPQIIYAETRSDAKLQFSRRHKISAYEISLQRAQNYDKTVK